MPKVAVRPQGAARVAAHRRQPAPGTLCAAGWPPGRQRPPWRRGGRCGQAIVDFALVVPIFLALLFGTIETGMFFKTYGAYQEAALEAVRVDAAAATMPDADRQALTQVQSTLAGENLANLSSVTVYDATASGAPIAPITTTGTVTGTFYTVYTYNRSSGFLCPGATTAPPCPSGAGWSPAVRNVHVPALDHVGLSIVYQYRGLTGLLPPITITQQATALIEPRSY